MINKDSIPYIIIVLLLIGLGILAYSTMQLKEQNRQMTDNIEQLLQDRDSKVLEIATKKFDLYIGKKDSLLRDLMDSMKLKPRHIERTINHKYTHIYDTTITLIKPAGPGIHETDTIKEFNHRFDDCVEIAGSINWDENTISFDTLKIDYNSTTAYYWKRKHKFWFIKWGRKKHYAITKNNCTGQTKVIDIKFER